MFYSGWTLPAPTSMNVGALSAEMRHRSTAAQTANPYVTELPLPEVAAATTGATRGGAERNEEGGGEAAGAPTQPPAPTPRCSSAVSLSSGSGSGCVLHLAPRAALSYKEMEQQLQRRGSGASDGFHVKSNVPVQAQTGVVLMECAVSRPAVPPARADDAAKTKSAATAPARHPLPALVVGVCPRQLPWSSLPGEVVGSVGFYAAQRLIVKHGKDDRDEVVVPLEATSALGGGVGSSSSSGGRVAEGDVVGCLVDLVRHTLVFTVNRQVVSRERLDATLEDGSLFFAVGLARRPQHTTNVAVRFYSGAACVRDAARVTGFGDGCVAAEGRALGACQPPCFPLTAYVRSLALELVRHRSPHGETGGSAVQAAAHTSAPAALTVSPASHAHEAVRDLRMAAVLRSFLAARGMAHTLAALDTELDELTPSQARLYAPPPPPPATNPKEEEDEEGAQRKSTVQQKAAPLSSLSPSSPVCRTAATPNGLAHQKRRCGSTPAPTRLSAAQETRAEWHTFAANMADLHRAVLKPPLADLLTTTSSAITTEASITSLLLTRVLWSPAVTAAFAQVARRGEERGKNAAAVRRGGVASPYAWVHAALSPAATTLCLLTVRQDIRYLLHAHYAVEELWRRLRALVQHADEMCSATCSKGHGAAAATAAAASVAQRTDDATADTQHEAVTAFTAFFTDLMWDARCAVPSAMAHDAPRRDSGAGSAASLHAPAVAVLASLAGHAEGAEQRVSVAAETTAVPRNTGHRAEMTSEVRRFLACIAGGGTSAPHAPTGVSASSASSAKEKAETYKVTSASRADHTISYAAPPVEEGVRFLYACAVAPASAPRRSAQSRLLQTLCSLLTHTSCTLRQLEALARGPNSSVEASDIREGNGTRLNSAVAKERGDSVRAALDVLRDLLDTVLHAARQAVWRRIAHAIEEVNAQLVDRLMLWRAVLDAAAAAPPRMATSGDTRAEAEVEDRAAAETESERGGERGGGVASAALGSEDVTSTRERASSDSLTASLSSFQAPEISEEAADDDDESSAAPPASPAAGHSASLGSYEAVTEALPSLRLLWRRVAARAALAPSRHLVTHLFVQELRDALAAAPRGASRVERAVRTSARAEDEGAAATAPAATPASTARHRVCGVEAVSVKRPSSSNGDGETPGDCLAASASAGARGGTCVEQRWFTEELYLCSVYMKRVVKHLDGH